MNICPVIISNTNSLKSHNKAQGTNYMSSINRVSFGSNDTFERQGFDISKDLKNIELGEKINEGMVATVYHTNYDDYVIRLIKGTEFDPKKMEIVEDGKGIVIAADKDDKMRLMKLVKGEPLYGKSWVVYMPIGKDEYMDHLDKIIALPDKTFSDYMKDVVNIRKSGYDIDNINPNNYLLDGTHINIIDLEKKSVKPEIKLADIKLFINYYHLDGVLDEMNSEEIENLSDKIKVFYDRIVSIADKNGYDLSIPEIDSQNRQDRDIYLYHKDWDNLNIGINNPAIDKLAKSDKS